MKDVLKRQHLQKRIFRSSIASGKSVVYHHVLPAILCTVKIIAKQTFFFHADFLHDPFRRPVFYAALGLYAMKAGLHVLNKKERIQRPLRHNRCPKIDFRFSNPARIGCF